MSRDDLIVKYDTYIPAWPVGVIVVGLWFIAVGVVWNVLG